MAADAFLTHLPSRGSGPPPNGLILDGDGNPGLSHCSFPSAPRVDVGTKIRPPGARSGLLRAAVVTEPADVNEWVSSAPESTAFTVRVGFPRWGSLGEAAAPAVPNARNGRLNDAARAAIRALLFTASLHELLGSPLAERDSTVVKRK
jgi:hypothetical protein